MPEQPGRMAISARFQPLIARDINGMVKQVLTEPMGLRQAKELVHKCQRNRAQQPADLCAHLRDGKTDIWWGHVNITKQLTEARTEVRPSGGPTQTNQIVAKDAQGQVRDAVTGPLSLDKAKRLIAANGYLVNNRKAHGWTMWWGNLNLTDWLEQRGQAVGGLLGKMGGKGGTPPAAESRQRFRLPTVQKPTPQELAEMITEDEYGLPSMAQSPVSPAIDAQSSAFNDVDPASPAGVQGTEMRTCAATGCVHNEDSRCKLESININLTGGCDQYEATAEDGRDGHYDEEETTDVTGGVGEVAPLAGQDISMRPGAVNTAWDPRGNA